MGKKIVTKLYTFFFLFHFEKRIFRHFKSFTAPAGSSHGKVMVNFCTFRYFLVGKCLHLTFPSA